MDCIKVNKRKFQVFIFCILLLLWNTILMCQCQCPISSQTFEKVSGASLKGASLSALYKGSPSDASVTRECLYRCRSSSDCNSMLLSYTGYSCKKSTLTSDGRRTDVAVTFPVEATSYFEKICLTAPRCSRLWTFERVIGYEISGFDDHTIHGVSSRIQCEDLCLKERGFVCRSGEYDYAFQSCRLSSEDRRSQPSSFKAAYGDVDYFENQCVTGGSTSCGYEEKPDTDMSRVDATLTANTQSECQQLCDSSRSFLCHAYSFREASATCMLSSDDTFGLRNSAIRKRIGTSYYQRSNCLDLKLTCTDTAMQLVLRTRESFDGRIYAQSEPHACQTYGNKQMITTFNMDVRGQCGVMLKDEDHLTNTVVIQYHPLIQQKGDRIIKLYCSLFEETNRTLTQSFTVFQGLEPPVTSVVNATAPTPNLRIRITNANGSEIFGSTRVGEQLYFRIEIDEDSVFGIFARNMTATNGRGDVKIDLIDENGCAVNPRIFPNFERIPNSKSLQSRFQAFKFSEDSVVKFQVNVHFCLEECSSVPCEDQASYGRRKRREAEEEGIVPDYKLDMAIRVEGSSIFDNSSLKDRYTDDRELEMSDELVCTTKTVVVVSSLGALFLQIGLLAACGTCLLLTRRDRRPKYSEDAASTVTETLPPPFRSNVQHTRLR